MRQYRHIEHTVDAETYLPLSQRAVTDVEDGLTRDRAKCSQFAHELREERDLGFPNPCR